MATIGFSKVFILDKYFTSLYKFWETEKKLQGIQMKENLFSNIKSYDKDLPLLPARWARRQAEWIKGGCAQFEASLPPLTKRRSRGNKINIGEADSDATSNEEAHLEQELKNLRSRLVTLGHQIHVGPHRPPQPSPSNNNNNNNNSNSNNNTIRHPTNQLINVGGGGGGGGGISSSSNLNHGFNKPFIPPHPQPINRNQLSSSNQSNYYVNHQSFQKDLQISNNQSASIIGAATSATPSESSHSSKISINGQQQQQKYFNNIEDLIHLPGALTEDAIIRCIQSRCSTGKYHVYMGSILLLINSLHNINNNNNNNNINPILKTEIQQQQQQQQQQCPLKKIVQEAYRQQLDTGYPQAIILSGCNGSGKTNTSILLLRELFQIANGGLETDLFKHLTASINVLKSLGTCKTISNRNSSRIGHFIEAQITEGIIYRARVHCYFLDQSRIVRTPPDERNYHIFYQMLAGLNQEERTKLHLTNHTCESLRYLNYENNIHTTDDDGIKFQEWKTSLAILGIPFFDVVRVLAAVILIGNVEFIHSSNMELDLKGDSELKSISTLLGISYTALKQGLTTRTINTRNQILRSNCDANLSNIIKNSLAKSLYCRTVATIVKRANSIKKISNNGTLSTDSTDSNQHRTKTVSTANSVGSKASMIALNNVVRSTTDSFIGILDMFGFEDLRPSHLEHLCINLCAETMQHFYNTHIFKASIESCHDEGIQCDWELDYIDNVPCIDLISSLRTGLLSMLDVECSINGTVENYIQKIHKEHKDNSRLLETKSTDVRSFAIQHYAGKVYYDATHFQETNRDVLVDDLVAVFHKHRCSFGFASHLFSSELKILGAGGLEPCPKGISFRISPTSHTDLLNGNEPISTLTQDFHTRLDNLLRTLVHSKPHFIRCIKLNNNETPDLFDRHTVSKQLRAFQILETVNLLANGYPHRIRFKLFNLRYKLLIPMQLIKIEERVAEDCQIILEYFDKYFIKDKLNYNWAIGKKHVFMSEGTRQQLEMLRTSARNRAATLIQCIWRGWHCRRKWPIQFKHCTMNNNNNNNIGLPYIPTEPCDRDRDMLNDHVMMMKTNNNNNNSNNSNNNNNNNAQLGQDSSASIVSAMNNNIIGTLNDNISSSRPRPQPITGTPPPIDEDCDGKLVQQTCNLFGLDMERPPPLPPSRSYTITGNTKFGYPQTRIMRMTFPDESTPDVRLLKGEVVLVLGASQRRGHLIVEYKNRPVHVPYQYLELKSGV